MTIHMKTASVVINTYNRAAYLRNAVRSIASQSYPEIELIVVNGPSTDDTEAVLEEVRGSGLQIKTARCANRNLSESRNIGIAEAAGDVVFFIDDDGVAHPDWVARIMSAYDDPEVGAVGGFTIDHTGITFQCRYTVCDQYGNATFLNLIDPTQMLDALHGFSFPSLLGTNSSFRRDQLLAINGFDETFAYFLDETDVCLRIFKRHGKILTVPQAFVFHKYAPSDLRSVERIPQSLFAPAKSKAYFVIKLGARRPDESNPALAAHAELERYSREIQFSNRWFLDHKKIAAEHYFRLDDNVRKGVSEGIRAGLDVTDDVATGTKKTDLNKGSHFKPLTGPERAQQVRKRLRIYFVSQGFPPQDTSGIARWTHECAKALTARGHEIHVITRSSTTNFVDYIDGIWIHSVVDEFPENQILPAPVEIPESLARRSSAVFTEIKRAEGVWGVDVVSAPIWDLEGLYCVKYLQKPVITSLHTTYLLALPSKPDWLDRPDYRRNHVDKVIAAEKWLLNTSARILGNSSEIVREIDSAYGVALKNDSQRVSVIPHGIASTTSASGADGRSQAGTALSVLFVGRIEQRKGVDQLLRALLRLRGSKFKVNVNIVGAWPSQTDRYAQLVSSLAKEVSAKRKDISITFTGYASEEVLLRHYESADIFVAPSRFESFGLIVIEAMRGGCPVIASDIGGMREIIDGTTGCLVKVDDPESLASSLDKLITDQALRTQMGEAGRKKFAATFTADVMAAQLETYFRGMVQSEVRT